MRKRLLPNLKRRKMTRRRRLQAQKKRTRTLLLSQTRQRKTAHAVADGGLAVNSPGLG